MVLEHRRALVACEKILQEALVQLLEHLFHDVACAVHHAFALVYELVVLAFGTLEVGERLLAERDAVGAVARVHEVDGEVVDDARVVSADDLAVEHVERVDDAHVERVGAILANVGDHVADADDAALQRGRTQRLDGKLVCGARFHEPVERGEVGRVAHAQHLLGELAVVAQHAVEGLQADVAAVQLVEHAHRVHVVVEVAPGSSMVARAQVALAGVAEGRVPYVVAQCDGLDELAVQPQQRPDAAGHAADQLHVQPAAADVVVLHEREHLRLVGVTVVRRHVEDLLDVARERGARERGVVVR